MNRAEFGSVEGILAKRSFPGRPENSPTLRNFKLQTISGASKLTSYLTLNGLGPSSSSQRPASEISMHAVFWNLPCKL